MTIHDVVSQIAADLGANALTPTQLRVLRLTRDYVLTLADATPDNAADDEIVAAVVSLLAHLIRFQRGALHRAVIAEQAAMSLRKAVML